MKRPLQIVSLGFFVAMSPVISAGGVSQHAGDAINHSMQTIAHTSAAGVSLVSGAVAVPFLFVGELGEVSKEIGDELWDEAQYPIGTPLSISEDIVTISPTPAEAMAREAEKQ